MLIVLAQETTVYSLCLASVEEDIPVRSNLTSSILCLFVGGWGGGDA